MTTETHIDAFLEVCPGFGWAGGAEFNTQIVQMQSGRERRNAQWAQQRHRYSAPFNNISIADYATIKTMHMACRGRLIAFKFTDRLDNYADDELFALGDGTTTTFQLRKISVVASVEYGRDITCLVGTPIITVAGVATAATVDQDRGLVTFASAPAADAELRWTGEFAVWVRFDNDYLSFSLDESPDVASGSVELIEVPPPVLP